MTPSRFLLVCVCLVVGCAEIELKPRRVVGGSASGIVGQLVLANNGREELTLTRDGPFTFVLPVVEGGRYDVTLVNQPPQQTCTIENGSGTIGRDEVSNVAVTCVTRGIRVGGTVSGLSGTVVLANNGTDTLTVTADGPFTFPNAIADGSAYAVTVVTQPQGQTCSVSAGTGMVSETDVTTVAVVCATDTYAISGNVSGLTGTLVIANNGADTLSLTANGPFTFPNAIADGSAYAVTVVTQPQSQTCTVNAGSGIVSGADVATVAIVCATNTYTVSGTVSGLTGTLVLANNAADAIALNSDGAFTFPAAIADGALYSVTVATQPATLTCGVSNGTGVITGGPVTNVVVTCAVNLTTLSVSVTDLALSVTGLVEYGVSGTPSSGQARGITFTNVGSTAAINLALVVGTFPSGTASTTTCSNTLPAGSSCTATITPGAVASSDGASPCGMGTVPVPTVVTVSADNANAVSSNVVILDYGCVYRGGRVFAFDDTTPTSQNVGGKTAFFDQPMTARWSSTSANDFDGGVPIFATNEVSTPLVPSPMAGAVTGQVACNGATDGACTSNNVVTYYNTVVAGAPVNYSFYAAGLCKQSITGFADWYLPALCELGYGSAECGTAASPRLQNAQSNLVSNGRGLLTGSYWTSTQSGGDPQLYAWFQYFDETDGLQFTFSKDAVVAVLCARTF